MFSSIKYVFKFKHFFKKFCTTHMTTPLKNKDLLLSKISNVARFDNLSSAQFIK